MPWVEMIETAMSAAPPDELLRRMGDAGPELARLVPELRRVVPGIPPPVEVSPDQQRRYTFNSIRDFLYRVSREQPRLYILEDLHWADEPTLSLLEHVADGLAGVPCLVVGTFRDPPADVSPRLAETLGRLVRRHVRIVNVKRHTETEVDDLLRAMSGQNPPARVGAAVYQETEGNAFLVEEVFRHFAENGRLFDDRGYFRDDIAIGELDVPSNVRLVTGQRLGRLSEPTQQMLGVAAVAGRHMGFELLEAIADLKGDDLIDALDEAEQAGVIFTDASADEEEYWFAHELTRQTLLTQLPAARRRRHHLKVAEAMERVFADDLDAHAATIAQHLGEVGSTVDRSTLFRFLLRAGTRALGSAAVDDALRLLGRAARPGRACGTGRAGRPVLPAGNGGAGRRPLRRRAAALAPGGGDLREVGRSRGGRPGVPGGRLQPGLGRRGSPSPSRWPTVASPDWAPSGPATGAVSWLCPAR